MMMHLVDSPAATLGSPVVSLRVGGYWLPADQGQRTGANLSANGPTPGGR
jgi:hypothetical protein